MTLTEDEILEQIKRETAENKVFLYMKGTPDMPRCGFSNQVIQILNHIGVDYGARDILADPRLRQVLSDWSTGRRSRSSSSTASSSAAATSSPRCSRRASWSRSSASAS